MVILVTFLNLKYIKVSLINIDQLNFISKWFSGTFAGTLAGIPVGIFLLAFLLAFGHLSICYRPRISLTWINFYTSKNSFIQIQIFTQVYWSIIFVYQDCFIQNRFILYFNSGINFLYLSFYSLNSIMIVPIIMSRFIYIVEYLALCL